MTPEAAAAHVVRVVRRILPLPIRQRARRSYREWVLQRAVMGMMRSDLRMCDRRAFEALTYGWGNEGYSCSYEYLVRAIQVIRAAPGPVLECGSGVSTLLIGRVAQAIRVPVFVLEHDPGWRDRIEKTLRRCHVENVQVACAPLRSYGDYAWYDPPVEWRGQRFRTIVCDGPPGETAGGRYGLLPVMHSMFTLPCTILLDDVARPSEQLTLGRWQRESGARFSISGSDRAFAEIQVL